MARIAIGIEYEGTHFSGWQKQPGLRTVQETLETAMAVVAGQTVGVCAAGRTDAGVHALAQVAHFDSTAPRESRSWVLGANAHLPEDCALRWARAVPEAFHARFSAIWRRYEYFVGERPARPALGRRHVAWVHRRLDIKRMQKAATYLRGRHDFSSFRSAECQAKTPVRTIREIVVRREDSFIRITVTADAFLHHMVRNIAGSLIEVGRGRREPLWIDEVLATRDRSLAGPTAPPQGLILAAIGYPRQFGLPRGVEDEWSL